MNSKRLSLTSSAFTGRAAFSPIRARQTTRVPASAPTAVLRFEPVELKVPAWHRGPLDRLQPVLTRYRD